MQTIMIDLTSVSPGPAVMAEWIFHLVCPGQLLFSKVPHTDDKPNDIHEIGTGSIAQYPTGALATYLRTYHPLTLSLPDSPATMPKPISMHLP